MGQYYLTVILAEKSDKEYIRTYLDPSMYGNGMKLLEHSYIGNNFMMIVENMIGPNGIFYKSRLVWAGDYADNEPDSDKNLHKMSIKKDQPARKKSYCARSGGITGKDNIFSPNYWSRKAWSC